MQFARNFIVSSIFLLFAIFTQQLWADNVNNPDKVKLKLLWHHQFQFAGYYIAREKGYYSASGLDVEISEYEGSEDNVALVLSGQTDFAVGRSNLLVDKAQGKDIVALYATFQTSPLMLLTKGFTGLNSPADLKGHKVMITAAAQRSGELLAMLAQSGLNPGDYIRQDHSFNIADLINDKTDAIASYISNEPYRLIQHGIPYNILHPADYGFKMYSDLLFTSGKLVRENPAMVEKFYQASIAGWKYAFANIQETAEIIYKKYNSHRRSKEALLFEGQELKKLAFDGSGNFGTLSPQRLQSMAQVYLLTGFLDEEPKLDGFIYHPPLKPLNLSYEELEYIKHKKSVNICVQSEWEPFEQFRNGQYEGIVADLLDLVRDKTGLSLQFKPTDSRQQAVTLTSQQICDATTLYNVAKNNTNLLLSDPIINITHAYLINNRDMQQQQITRHVAILNQQFCNYCTDQLLPSSKLTRVNSLATGIRYLREQRVDSVFASEAQLQLALSRQQVDDLYINKELLSNSGLSLGVFNQPALLSILNKGIQAISQQERDRIFSQRMIAIPDPGIRTTTYWIIISLIALISLFFTYRFYRESMRNRILKELSETDQLTGIANRRKIIEEINKFINLSLRYSNNLSLVYFDIDDFKMVNDQFGHEAGDLVLVELAQLIQKNIRKTDLFARLGGEEFVILSPESDIADCKNLLSGLRKKIANHQFTIKHQISCSFGIAQFKPQDTSDSLINRADAAMYQAKRSGKNTIVAVNQKDQYLYD